MPVKYGLCRCPCLHQGITDLEEDCDDIACGYCGEPMTDDEAIARNIDRAWQAIRQMEES